MRRRQHPPRRRPPSPTGISNARSKAPFVLSAGRYALRLSKRSERTNQVATHPTGARIHLLDA